MTESSVIHGLESPSLGGLLALGGKFRDRIREAGARSQERGPGLEQPTEKQLRATGTWLYSANGAAPAETRRKADDSDSEVQGDAATGAGRARREARQPALCCASRIRAGPICYLGRTGGFQAEFALRQVAPRGKFMNRPLALVTVQPGSSGN